MPRPRKLRSVHRPPVHTDFKPAGARGSALPLIDLSLDEFESVRLADHLGMDQEEAAAEMEISRSTFSRLVEGARQKVARFLVEGTRLRIAGGDVHFVGNRLRCASCGNMYETALAPALDACPSCGSRDLIDLAGGFGHGRCCRRHHRRRGR